MGGHYNLHLVLTIALTGFTVALSGVFLGCHDRTLALFLQSQWMQRLPGSREVQTLTYCTT